MIRENAIDVMNKISYNIKVTKLIYRNRTRCDRYRWQKK